MTTNTDLPPSPSAEAQQGASAGCAPTAGSGFRKRFGYAIAVLKTEIEHWTNDRETDPEFSDAMVEEMTEAIEMLGADS